MLADLSLAMGQESPALVSFLFHSLFQDERERNRDLLDPQQGITMKMFRRFVEYFLEKGYLFVSPEDLLGGIATSGKYILLTFDDGYCNNLRSIPVLEEFGVPAVFFLSTNHIQHQKSFWWDVLFREFRKRGRSERDRLRAIARYKQMRSPDIELELKKDFGQDALKPVSDLDRPLQVNEVRELAKHRLVWFGNHTKDHAILTNYSRVEIDEQIQGAQKAIEEWIGKAPEIIAYPNGAHSEDVVSAALGTGLRLGVTTRSGKNRLPLFRNSKPAMGLSRFTLWGDREVEPQCRISRSDVSIAQFLGGRKGNLKAAFVTAD